MLVTSAKREKGGGGGGGGKMGIAKLETRQIHCN
jgi:hypothetical protein